MTPFSWRDRPALIESLFPVQKLSVESFKEQMSNTGKVLTSLGSYWKGRKPLVLNKACILGCLMPATNNSLRDLEIFELLMAMDQQSLNMRLQYKNDPQSRLLLSQENKIGSITYREYVYASLRPEECPEEKLYAHIWDEVNEYLGTNAFNFADLIEQMGIARFGKRPTVADIFSGSGQIPFEAARLGCNVYASDLNPVACMLTWGAFNVVGASALIREKMESSRVNLVNKVREIVDELDIESDGKGWKIKALLYCLEVKCPESGWTVPLLPTRIISKDYKSIAKLIPDPINKRYSIMIENDCSPDELKNAATGTVANGEVTHSPDGVTVYRTKISTIRGDVKSGKTSSNALRLWEKTDFMPRPDDLYQERLYCLQWIKPKRKGKGYDLEIRAVTNDDLMREIRVADYLQTVFSEWQEKGYVPSMKIEPGYNTDQPIRERGWTYWHHLFNPRQLLLNGLVNQYAGAELKLSLAQLLNYNSRLCIWHNGKGQGGGSVSQVFYNQALNTLFNYGCRGFELVAKKMLEIPKSITLSPDIKITLNNHSAEALDSKADIFITDPPYGGAVNYDEITEFFIGWLGKQPPAEFSNWIWDSRRSLAIKGEDEAFRQGMIRAYRRTCELMPNNGIQLVMFTHQSGSIWSDMANIIWASGLQVTAAWYVVTETDSALRDGANVTGTIMLVLRKRLGQASSFRDDLGWEIEAAVKQQIEGLTGLDQQLRERGSEGLYTDADLQMAGYAAALKVLTAYSHIDGKDMVVEAEAPKLAGRKSFVEELIDFAVQTAVQFLVPIGFDKSEWQKLSAIERFYLKMVEMEAMGEKSLDNYQNFSKAFKVKNFSAVMSDSSKANHARLKLSTELKTAQISGEGELPGTPLRALLYALFELSKGTEVDDVLNHLGQTHPHYLRDKKLIAKIADYLANKRAALKASKTFDPQPEAQNARILAEAIRNQKL